MLRLIIVIGGILYVINDIIAMITVFKQKRDIAAIWSWLLVLHFLPVIGFCFYLVFGKRLSQEKIFNLKTQTKVGIQKAIANQKAQWQEHKLLPETQSTPEVRELVHMFLEEASTPLTTNNGVSVFTDGSDKFRHLIADINRAKNHVNVEYYSFYNDRIGRELLAALEASAARGVCVRVIYDSFGSHGTTRRFFRRLIELGGQVEPFFGAKKSLSSLRLNYRMHRKIVVIDGSIGYIGGFNVGDQYLGRKEKFGYWRDTHLRLEGGATSPLQTRFFMDWNATVKHSKFSQPLSFTRNYFPKQHEKAGSASVQIVSSGPDNDREMIKLGYLKMISNANDYIYIQTPYLIPDDSVLETLTVAALSGVKVKIMVPSMPDHAFVYRATEYYAKQLSQVNGIEVYRYDAGFLHAKTMVVDDVAASVGSANLDFRSFKLNFEANAFCYDRALASQLRQIFERDLTTATLMDTRYFAEQSRWRKFKQYFSRMLSPIL